MLPWAECEKGASWWGWLCPSSSPLHSLDFDPALFGIDDCSEQIQSPISLSLSLPPSPPFFPTPSLFLPLSVYLSIPEHVYTFLPHALMFLFSLSVPLWFSVALLLSPHLSVCASLYVGVSLSLQVCLYPSSLSLFPLLSPSQLLPTWATPPAAWGPTQPSHSAHIFNSHLLSLLLPFLAVGHSKQNVRKQKLMRFFQRGWGASVISFSPPSLTSGTCVTSPNGKWRLLLFNLVGLCSTFRQLKCTLGAKSQQGRQEGCECVRNFFFKVTFVPCSWDLFKAALCSKQHQCSWKATRVQSTAMHCPDWLRTYRTWRSTGLWI